MYQERVIRGLEDDSQDPVDGTLWGKDVWCLVRKDINSMHLDLMIFYELLVLRRAFFFNKHTSSCQTDHINPTTSDSHYTFEVQLRKRAEIRRQRITTAIYILHHFAEVVREPSTGLVDKTTIKVATRARNGLKFYRGLSALPVLVNTARPLLQQGKQHRGPKHHTWKFALRYRQGRSDRTVGRGDTGSA